MGICCLFNIIFIVIAIMPSTSHKDSFTLPLGHSKCQVKMTSQVKLL